MRATIYKGMFEFMILQCIAIAILIAYPQVATWLPEKLNAEFRAIQVEQVEDNVQLDDYQPEGGYGKALREALQESRDEDKKEEGGDALEKDESAPGAPAKDK